MELKISIFQFDIQWLNPKKNISLIRNHINSIKTEVDLVILPEMYLSGFCMDPTQSAISEEGAEIQELVDIAREHETAIIGSLAIEEGGEYYNRVLLISADGIIGRYDKQYLFSHSGENEVFSIRYETNLIQFKGWNILPQVCYDLRFPENVRSLPAPHLLIYMANWPAPRIQHWDALLKARAIENQCFTVGCNRIGSDGNGWEYPGHSQVIQPDGRSVFVESDRDSEVMVLDQLEVNNYRSKYQFLKDRKD